MVVVVTAKVVILQFVCPAFGMIMANCMFSAPAKDLYHAVQRGHLGDLNPTPWAFMLGNTFAWVLYSMLIQNYFIFFANAPGFLLSVWLNLGAVKLIYQRHHSQQMRQSITTFLQSQEQQQQQLEESRPLQVEENNNNNDKREQSFCTTCTTTSPCSCETATTMMMTTTMVGDQEKELDTTKNPKEVVTDWAKLVWNVTSQSTPAPAPHERLVLGVVTIYFAMVSFLVFGNSILSGETKEIIVGVAANLNLVFFYGAPLSTIWTVLKERNSISIHIPTMITNTLNGTFWTAYGIAIFDYIVAVPNGLGTVLGAIQIALCLIFPPIPTNPLVLIPNNNHDIQNDGDHRDNNSNNIASDMAVVATEQGKGLVTALGHNNKKNPKLVTFVDHNNNNNNDNDKNIHPTERTKKAPKQQQQQQPWTLGVIPLPEKQDDANINYHNANDNNNMFAIVEEGEALVLVMDEDDDDEERDDHRDSLARFLDSMMTQQTSDQTDQTEESSSQLQQINTSASSASSLNNDEGQC